MEERGNTSANNASRKSGLSNSSLFTRHKIKKWFHSHDPRQKIKKKVHFGPTLDLKPFVSGSYVS